MSEFTEPAHAVPNDNLDDSGAIRSAVNAIPAEGGTLYFPPGIYDMAFRVVVSKPIVILGSGPGVTILRTMSNQPLGEEGAFAVSLSNSGNGAWIPTVFRDLSFRAAVPTPGAAIYYSVGPAWAYGLRVENVHFGNGYYVALYLTAVSAMVVDRCFFGGSTSYEIWVDNTINADVGDNRITNSTFHSGLSTATAKAAILHRGGGGITILGNKFLGYQYHYYNDMSLGSAPEVTSIVHFANNSSEWASLANVLFYGREVYDKILIQDNDFSLGALDPGNLQIIDCGPTTSAVKVLTQTGGTNKIGLITGNVFQPLVLGSCSGVVVTPSGANQATDWRVADNNFNGLGTAISIGSGAERIEVGENKYSFVTTKIANSSTSSGSMMRLINNGFTPTSQPDGGVLFVQGGALKYRGSSGTVTTLAVP